MLKHTDPETLFEISEEAVTSSGMGIYRQKKAVTTEESEDTRTENPKQPRPEQLRQKFSQTLKVQCMQYLGNLKDYTATRILHETTAQQAHEKLTL